MNTYTFISTFKGTYNDVDYYKINLLEETGKVATAKLTYDAFLDCMGNLKLGDLVVVDVNLYGKVTRVTLA